MTRPRLTEQQALALLNSPADLTYDGLDDVFRAFGFESDSPDFETEVYYHADFLGCGGFTARDDGLHVVTSWQRYAIRAILECVTLRRAAARQTARDQR